MAIDTVYRCRRFAHPGVKKQCSESSPLGLGGCGREVPCPFLTAGGLGESCSLANYAGNNNNYQPFYCDGSNEPAVHGADGFVPGVRYSASDDKSTTTPPMDDVGNRFYCDRPFM